MSQLLGCLEHLQKGALSMVTSVWGKENNHRVINQWSRADVYMKVTLRQCGNIYWTRNLATWKMEYIFWKASRVYSIILPTIALI